jgi:arogenate dehydrogenase (NADP+)
MRIAIVGLGLIGGSLALKLTEAGYSVWGISRNPATCQEALERGAVQGCGTELAQLTLFNPQVVVICTPLEQVLATLAALVPYLSPQTVVSDVGSVKQPIVGPATALWPLFVGGHPMAGKTLQGIQGAEANLFLGRPYVLTPIPQTQPQALAVMQELVAAVGAEVVLADPVRHDQAVAWVSHLPVMVGAGLIAAVSQEEKLEYSGTGPHFGQQWLSRYKSGWRWDPAVRARDGSLQPASAASCSARLPS